MTKMLTKSGNSLALVIDKPLLQLMNLDETTPVQIEFDGKRLIVSPAAPDDRKRFEAAKAMAHRQYARAFKRLAE